MPALVPRTHFTGAGEGEAPAYLLTAGFGLAPQAALEALPRYFVDRAAGPAGLAHMSAVERTCREKLARLLDAAPDDIALLGSASEGINAVYQLIDWQPGDNIVVPVNALEFPSVVLPAARLERHKVEVRAVPHENWVITPEKLAAACDERTRLVCLSHVSYRTGYRFDLSAFRTALDRVAPDALLLVDATQSLGVVPVPAAACDFLVASTCKWLLGPHGMAVFYWNRARRPNVEPAAIGWYSVVDDLQFPYELKPNAGRFELGAPNHPGHYLLEPALDLLLQTGIERIEAHALALTTRLLEQLPAFDLDIITPDARSQRAGIVAWLDDHPRATAAALAEHGVLVTGSSGRVRVALHLYNDEEDVDTLVTALQRIASQ
jgi:selenocysteine lyase/cysteine desulfurase